MSQMTTISKQRTKRTILKGLLTIAISVLLCSACAVAKPTETKVEKTEEITIPASFIHFINSDAEKVATSYEDYCAETIMKDGDVILSVTEKQKNKIVNMNCDFIDETIETLEDAAPEYSFELAEDYSSATYRYDENIDGILQAKLLLGITSMHVLNGILVTGNSDWSIEVTIMNCHNDNVVARGTLPDDTINLDDEIWEASYLE